MEIEEFKIPKFVFVVPYRNRVQQKFFFSKYMSFLLQNVDDYEIYFSHQHDNRSFNRGATKNIGFLAVKNKYPLHYKDINFIFNDVDTVPFNKIFKYETEEGIVKHYYGFKYALGGILVMKGSDFEKINGFPCFWGWGMEDACLQKRCLQNDIIIDRDEFYEIGSPEILQLFDGISRIISKKDPLRMQQDDGFDGIRTIYKLNYTIDSQSANPDDNLFIVENPKIFYINIKSFLTHVRFEEGQFFTYDLREPKSKIIQPEKNKETQNIVTTTEDWTNIPYYPTLKEKRENLAKILLSNGKQLPPFLIKQIEQDKNEEYQNDNYNGNTFIPEQNMCAKEIIYRSKMDEPIQNNQQEQVYQQYQQYQQYQPYQTYHLFSKEYRSRQPILARTSARIKLGGAY